MDQCKCTQHIAEVKKTAGLTNISAVVVRCSDVCSLYQNFGRDTATAPPAFRSAKCTLNTRPWARWASPEICDGVGIMIQTQKMRRRTGGLSFFVFSLDHAHRCGQFQAVKKHGQRRLVAGGWVHVSDGRGKNTCIGDISDSVHDNDRSPRIKTYATQDAIKPRHSMTKQILMAAAQMTMGTWELSALFFR